ncbi:hypothetical protein ALC56_03366 [Trachymyrmex septentrionalis]|uniref:Uncharacterized protein n=1 Tax=Trachymyrmex septentrionalis TaxID=34720 RepID=A0A195FP46_9HYME|nr:PREDICTED: uncharacterized protein LOC108745924 [Trachymyrmex septentrionalis]KYN42228.1 hypothetical protein ALC56_03366 [Trachymyrmex septentrionalis]
MSQIIHTSDKNKKHKRATISNVFSSTPIKPFAIKPGSISLSEIDTGSSSSGGKITRNLRSLIRVLENKHKKYSKEKRRSNIKWRIKDSDSEWEAKPIEFINQSLNEKRKKNLKNKKKTVKKKLIVTQIKSKDNEWETESEKSINEDSICSSSTLKNEHIKLFEDPCSTPEKTRDASTIYKEILPESPILGSFRKRSNLISKKNDIVLSDELLPVNLLSSEIRNPEEPIEGETIFDYEGNEKAHVSLQKLEINSKQISENISFPDLQFDTINFCRDQPIKTYSRNSRKTSPHFTLSFELSPIKLMSWLKPKLPNASRKTESTSTPPKICVSQYRNKYDKKWKTYRGNFSEEELKNDKREIKISKRNMRNQKRKVTEASKRMKTKRAFQSTLKQKYDIYDIYNETDIEFETGGRDGKRMSFREFCQTKDNRNHKMSPSDNINKISSSSDSLF